MCSAASALLSIVLVGRGHERVHKVLVRSRIHAVNLAEVVGRLVRSGMPAGIAVTALYRLRLEVDTEFRSEQAEFCGTLLGTRRDLGLSLGGWICLTVAASSSAVAVTADRRWMELDGTVLSDKTVRVELIR